MITRKLPRLLTALSLSLVLHLQSEAAGETFVMPAAGEAVIRLTPGVASAAESGEIVAELAGILGRITGAEPAVASGDVSGLVLAVAADLPELAAKYDLDPANAFGREDYLMVSSPDRLLLLGASVSGVRMAVADLLHRWGYRMFFASPAWEIVPNTPRPSLAVDEVQRPAFAFRDIFTVNFLPGEKETFARWCWLNRLGSGFTLNTRHAYNRIYGDHRAEFDANPDYFAVPPVRDRGRFVFKFNATNQKVIDLVVEDSKRWLEANPDQDSISMEPSDWSGWAKEGEVFDKIGGPSNQAMVFANAVAKQVAAPRGKYVGMYAYYEHQFPPTVAVEPNMIVSFATRFLRPGRDLYQSIRDWRAQGLEVVGIREYHSYTPWDMAMPGRALGGNMGYLSRSIPRFNELGSRLYTSESQSAWGAYGLGYYLTTRLLWNANESVDAIVADFTEKSFGPATEPMTRFYSLLNGDDSVAVRYVGPERFYSLLAEALAAAGDREDVRARIADLIGYVRYYELLSEIERAGETEKAALVKDIYTWVFGMEPRKMLPTRALAFRNGVSLRGVYKQYLDLANGVPETMHRATPPITDAELFALLGEKTAGASPVASVPEFAIEKKAVSSPWLRNSAALIFQLGANESIELGLSMRRFGFSEHPRYFILGPDGSVAARGEMRGLRDTATIRSREAGAYTLVFEYTTNIVKVDAPRNFLIKPTSDTATLDIVDYRGSVYFTMPAGASGGVAVGGQSTGERVGVKLFSESGELLAANPDASGVEPMRTALPVADKPATYRIVLDRPESGHFEDQFITFVGGAVEAVALRAADLPKPAAKTR